jgi:hypothetical protein
MLTSMTARSLILLALLLAQPVRAAPPAEPVLRLGGRMAGPNCTAVLVAPGAALTAGHCARRGHARLYSGWEDGRAAAMRRGELERRPRLDPRRANLYHLDQSRLRLAAPFPDLAPARPGPPPEVGSEVVVLSFPRHAPKARRAACRVLDRPGTEIVLDCPAIAGMSGAPIFQDGRLVGILTNRIGGGRSLGTILAPDLLD